MSHLFLQYLLVKHGMTPDAVKIVSIGTGVSAVASVQHQAVDSAVVSGSDQAVINKRVPGASTLLDVSRPAGCRKIYGVDVYPSGVVFATGAWLRDIGRPPAVAIGTAASAAAAVQHDMVDAAVLSGSESTVAMFHRPTVQMLVDSRGPVSCRTLFGVDVYPTAALFATDGWLWGHRDEARRLGYAMHSSEEVFEAAPRSYRMDNKEAELEALRISKDSFSRDGIMPAEGAEAVRKAIAFTLVSVRNAHFDLVQTYTNEFVEQQ